jgi:septum formation initiator
VSVLLLMAALYVSPVQKYLGSSQRLRDERAQLATLQRQHDRLAAESAALTTNARIEVLARACGFIFPNEHPLVITDIPAADATSCG